ncbi:MAG: hypothetical protein KAT65_17215 [Methanophagales archaeon]|nr:hypothetical protein [Methanophagales archaeon]
MSEVEVEGNTVTRHESGSDMHTISLLTEHSVFSPADKGEMLPGEVAEAAEGIIRENCEVPYTIVIPASKLCI